MKKSSFMAQRVKSTFYKSPNQLNSHSPTLKRTYVIRIIHIQNPTPTLIHLLMALATPPHAKRSIHMHIMARQIQTNQSLEHDAPTRERAGEENEKAGCSAAIGNHV